LRRHPDVDAGLRHGRSGASGSARGWQKDGKRGMEINLIKTRQEVSEDFFSFVFHSAPVDSILG
jgi:hypothetical protein